jgi:phosphoglycolate phosphatase-like HAD superfamily hydrolase
MVMTQPHSIETGKDEISVMHYQQLVFDCDGVLFDSNEIKAANIKSAAADHCDSDTLTCFVEHFVANNGVPRQEKVARFFRDSSIRESILSRYAQLNATTFGSLEVLPAARAFLDRLRTHQIPLYAITGGEERETAQLLTRNQVDTYFTRILGGPTTKAEHLAALGLEGPTCFFGDSAHDYMVAESFAYDFVFLTRYTQMQDWRSFFADRPHVFIAYDFDSLTDWLPCSE